VPVVGVVSCGIVTDDEATGTELDAMGRSVGREEGCGSEEGYGREEKVTRVREDEVGMLE
jgi:hypothetical protein